MADNAVLFKFLAKSVGMKHGITPSFMAKPWGNVSSRARACHYLFDLTVSQLPGCSGLVRSAFSFAFAHWLRSDTFTCRCKTRSGEMFSRSRVPKPDKVVKAPNMMIPGLSVRSRSSFWLVSLTGSRTVSVHRCSRNEV